MPHSAAHASALTKRPRFEVADIFRAHGPQYRASHLLSRVQQVAMWCIEACRTAILGGHVDKCLDCNHVRDSYNSCRNRNCPKCQALNQERWLNKRMQRILPVPYFHVVFTLPAKLKPLARKYPKLIYNALFQAASQTLLQLGNDPKRLGAQLGITAVLHTWTRDLRLHPHLHCVVTGGGLTPDGLQWRQTGKGKFLFHKKVIAKLFRRIFIDTLQKHQEQKLLGLNQDEWLRLRSKLLKKKWVVYAKRPFGGPKQVFSYLGMYTHRVAISNHRIVDVTEDCVTIKTRHEALARMHPLEFIRRFLNHVLPTGFVKIRHFGLMASTNVNTRLCQARNLLEPEPQNQCESQDNIPDACDDDWQKNYLDLTGIDLTVCPACGSKRLVRQRQFESKPNAARAPP
jgi:hypothetical protein